jgi:hypothetical protein
MIGGQRRLLDRLVEFFEQKKDSTKDSPADRKTEN